jgi:hypothetical protein
MSFLLQTIFVALAGVDFLTTRYVVRHAGPSAEINPLWRFGFERHPILFDVIYVSGIILLAALSLQFESWLILGLIASFTVIAVNNFIAVVQFARHRKAD